VHFTFVSRVLIIAHRLSTVEKADRIIVIDRGQVIEQGTHQQLIAKKGMVANLVKRQLLIPDASWSADSTAGLRKDLMNVHLYGQEMGSVCSTCLCKRRVSSRHTSGNSVISEDGGKKVKFVIGSI
jgi:ABC-type multidrug transport system ATPase subunit